MGTYVLTGTYIDPETRRRTPPGSRIDLGDDEAERLRSMLADPSEAADGGIPVEPARGASKAEWVAWAEHVADGDAERLAAIDSMTKDELVAEYGSA